jgi:hypothetical protein
MAQNEPYFILCALSVAYEFIHETLSSENAGAPAPPLLPNAKLALSTPSTPPLPPSQ